VIRALLVAACVPWLLTACIYGNARPHDDKVAVTLLRAAQAAPIVIADTLEALIADGRDTTADREWAYFEISHRSLPTTAADAFARAATAGRIAQLRGLNAGALVKEVEHFGRLSNQLDPTFRRGAARRLLATLYVMAPSAMVRYGDSETGVEILEDLVAAYPEDLENPLRLGEALLSLGDEEGAVPHLCRCEGAAEALRADDRQLLGHLLAEAGHPRCPTPAPLGATQEGL